MAEWMRGELSEQFDDWWNFHSLKVLVKVVFGDFFFLPPSVVFFLHQGFFFPSQDALKFRLIFKKRWPRGPVIRAFISSVLHDDVK